MIFCQWCRWFVGGQILTRISNNIIHIYMLSVMSVLFFKLKREKAFWGSFSGVFILAPTSPTKFVLC